MSFNPPEPDDHAEECPVTTTAEQQEALLSLATEYSSNGDADKNLDWLNGDSQFSSVLNWTAAEQRVPSPILVVPAVVSSQGRNELIDDDGYLVVRMEQVVL